MLWLKETPSTHQLLRTPRYSTLPDFDPVAAYCQTAGRGQRGNHWESEPYSNLTFSMICRPSWLHPSLQFSLSEATALAIVSLLHEFGIRAIIKWPNDIYTGDRKIAGILIEHSLENNKILRSILSVGLNINQRRFLSDAPNPTSILNTLPDNHDNEPIDIHKVAQRLTTLIRQNVMLTQSADGRRSLHKALLENLYRNDGNFYPYFDNLRQREIMARIDDVGPDGRLYITDSREEKLSFLFKEITFII